MYNNFFEKAKERCVEGLGTTDFRLCECFESYDEFYTTLKAQETRVIFKGRYESWSFNPCSDYIGFFYSRAEYGEISTDEFFNDFHFFATAWDDDYQALVFYVCGV